MIAAAVGYLIYSAARETSAYYVTMDEFLPKREALAGQPLRLAGRVTTGSVKWNPRTLDLAFAIEPIPPREKPDDATRVAAQVSGSLATSGTAQGAVHLPVSYNGILPDMFADGRDVIVEGKFQDGTFHAKSLLTTCPSKYEADQHKAEDVASGVPAR